MEELQEKWYDNLERLAECMVCLNTPDGYFLHCDAGHHICMICSTRLDACPKCKQVFLCHNRSFLAENLIQELKQMKKDMESTAKCKNITVEKCTQTDSINKEKKCSATQTGDAPRPDTFHFCLIGSCIFRSSYRGLIHHLADHHKDVFYEADPMQETFSEKCMINMTVLPQFLDFAFSINGMGLFFFKIVIHGFGQLQISVQRVQTQNHIKPFHYDFMVANQIRRHGKVVPQNGRELNKENSVFIHPQEMSRIMKFSSNRLFECMITIKKCFCDKTFAKRHF